MNSSLDWEIDSWVPETLETAFLSVLYFKNFLEDHAPDPPR